MEQLIPFENRLVGQEPVPTVDGRAIHAFLESQDHYTDWVKYQIERGKFVENCDFIINRKSPINSGRGRPSHEYFFTFKAAKHIAMMSHTNKGNQVRDYFIFCEEELRRRGESNEIVDSELDILDGMLRELRRYKGHIKEIPGLRRDVDDLQAWRIEQDKKQKIRQWHAERAFPLWVVRWGWKIMDGRCMKCRRKLDPAAKKGHPTQPHDDHIIPKNCGGLGVVTNYQLLCSPCNTSKGGCRHGRHNHSDYRPADVQYDAEQIAVDKKRQTDLAKEQMEQQLGFLFDDLTLPDDPLDPRPED